MSNVEAVPSRISALVRMLREPMTEEVLFANYAPLSLSESGAKSADPYALPNSSHERSMATKCRASAVSAGLVLQKDGLLSSDLAAEADTRHAIRHAILQEVPEKNRDLLDPLAWWLLQAPNLDQKTGEFVLEALEFQIAGERLGIKKRENFDLWLPWVWYLGFAVPLGNDIWVPDPTAYLSTVVEEILAGNDSMLLDTFLQQVRKRCPVWPGGSISREVEDRLPPLPPGHLRWSESVALLRLSEHGNIHLDYRADGKVLTLNDGGTFQYTSIRAGVQ